MVSERWWYWYRYRYRWCWIKAAVGSKVVVDRAVAGGAAVRIRMTSIEQAV